MKKNVSVVIIAIGLIMVLVGGIYNIYSDGIVREELLINTPYLKSNLKSGTLITEDMIGYKEIPESEYEALKKDVCVYSVDIVGKCLSTDMKDGDYFYINKLVECEVPQDSNVE